MSKKVRLDQLLVEKGLSPTPSQAQALIRAGKVLVEGEQISKPGTQISAQSRIEIKPSPRYVSRGGIKLESALRELKVEVKDKTCLDVGASTGGFTDCLLQFGAKKVYALDVGKGLLHWKLRNHPKVVVIEGFNARYLSPEIIPEKIQLATIDVSFISLTKILPSLKTVLKEQAQVLTLVKPQFELERKMVKKGVVRDPEKQLRAVKKIEDFARDIGFKILGKCKSGLLGPKGNQEYFLWLGLGI